MPLETGPAEDSMVCAAGDMNDSMEYLRERGIVQCMLRRVTPKT